MFADYSEALAKEKKENKFTPNFVQITCQIKMFSVQELDFDRSVYMAAICYSSPITTISTDIVALVWAIIYTKFREDIW